MAVSTFQRLVNTLDTPKDTPELREKLHKTRQHIGQLVKDTSSKLKSASEIDHGDVSELAAALKVLPITRGEGLWQKGMEMALSKLNKGEWVHIFPEGSPSKDGGKTIQFAKRGVGRLVYDSTNTPLVVPFVHSRMQEVIPIGSKLPQVNKNIVVLVGDPIKVDDIINISKEKNLSDIEIYDAISLRIGDQLHQLKDQLDELVSNQSLLNRSKHYQRALKFTDSISQFFDWESNTMLSEELLADVKMSSPSLHPDTTMQHVSNCQQHHLDGAKTVTYQNEKLEADLGRGSLYANNLGLNGECSWYHSWRWCRDSSLSSYKKEGKTNSPIRYQLQTY